MPTNAKSPPSWAEIRREFPGTTRVVCSVFALVTYATVRNAYDHYLRWLSLGQGGLPRNAGGWLVQWMLLPFGTGDVTSVRPYSRPHLIAAYGGTARKSYLKRALPRRDTERPLVDPIWTVPQGQESGFAPVDDGVREKQSRLLEDIVLRNNDLRIATSGQEGHGPAIFLAESLKPASWANRTNGEIAHFHTDLDWSGHVSLTPADAMEVVEQGWGQRHMLSHHIHIGYTMIYTPRTHEQLQVVGKIVEAACAAMVDGSVEKA